MNCSYLNRCGSCTLDMPYVKQIEYKTAQIQNQFKPFYDDDFEFFESNETHYRIRAEFGLWHEGDKLFYTMHAKDGSRLKVLDCPKVDFKIYEIMPRLLDVLSTNQKLKERVFGCEFVSSFDELIVVLLYHKDLVDMQESLDELGLTLGVNVVAKARKQKIFSSSEIISDNFSVLDLKYKMSFSHDSFIQPNKMVNEKMISWASQCVGHDTKDLLEMYCGFGNFTIPLSFKFNKVLATEISKRAVKLAHMNCVNNGVDNIQFIRLNSDELIEAFNKARVFNRLRHIDLDSFEISHILLDPPRAGLSDAVIDFVKKYENIIYISCNPTTLYENLIKLTQTHKVEKFAIFDQFANTNHIECGVLLKRNK